MTLDREVGPVKRFVGGETRGAQARSRRSSKDGFDGYGDGRNRPEAAAASHMSPYLHFGQISPVEIALAVREAKAGDDDDRGAYLEELIVRRELAMNHVFYRRATTATTRRCRTGRARRSPSTPRTSARTSTRRTQLAAGETHDRYWNAAMREMRETGYMHNQLRMYWGKKILEWSPSPEEGFDTDARGSTTATSSTGATRTPSPMSPGCSACTTAPGPRRPIFGTVRYQSENSLKKFDAKAYVKAVERLCAAEG